MTSTERGEPAMTRSGGGFLGASALLFCACAVLTVTWCASMSGMEGMRMPGGWTMSMTWMLMPGQSWPGAAASFVGMWAAMMTAMMLPSVAPTLWRYRTALARAGARRPDLLTGLAAAGYFSVWTLLGIAAFPIGVVLANAEMQHEALARAVPIAASTVVLIAGALQFTRWKSRQLACCRDLSICRCAASTDAGSALKCGFRLGIRCTSCCAGLTAILLVTDVMDLRAMAALTVGITLERLLPPRMRAAQAVGIAAIAAGLVLLRSAIAG
ncbi:MAG TPA: DUF2182 domain-containing protein [Steroidobacteraceae bacterium]|nr:DUF2182 domain-containing protein [Steroidobacteraceae bacterium]